MKASGTIHGGFSLDEQGLRGFAYDAGDLCRRLVVELLVDGWPVDLARADDHAPEASGIGDGCYGFGFRLPDAVEGDGSSVEVRVANTGEPIGGRAGVPRRPSDAEAAVGRAEWTGGLRFTGWVEPPASGEVPKVRLVVERRSVAEADARGFVAVPQGAVRRTMARFDIRLPAAYADGRVHRVTLLDGQGRELAGSPLSVLAFGPGVAFPTDRDDEDPRTALIERLTPRSVPFASWDLWSAGVAPPETPEPGRPVSVAVILLGHEIEASLASLDEQIHASWYATSAPDVHGPGTFDPAAVAATLTAEGGTEAVVILPAGARLHPRALSLLGDSAAREQALVYPDATVDTAAGRLPLLWPAFDPARQRDQGYGALAFAAPSTMVARALRAEVPSVFALFDALAAEGTPIHLPEVLIHLPRPAADLGVALAAAATATPGTAAQVLAPDRETGLPRVAAGPSRRNGTVAVAVIQPEPWEPDLAAVAARLPAAGERLVVSHRPLAAPDGWRNVVAAGPRNPSALRAAAIDAARSAHLLLLDAGVEPGDRSAIPELLGEVAAGAVAAGGLLLDRDGAIASAGLVLGPGFSAMPAFAGFDSEDGGYAGMLAVARGCGALDAAAILVDRASAARVGGFDAALFAEHFGGVDFCLKLREAGGRLVWSPRARFVRRRGWRHGGPAGRAEGELALLRRLWGRDLADDPCYHPGLNGDAEPFTGLAWPPRPRGPRRPAIPRKRSPTREAP